MNPKDQTQKTEELTDKQKRLLSILIETPNITEAAQRAGIGRSTAQRWMKNSVFRKELDNLRRDAMKEAMNSVHSYTAKAVDGLVRLMDSSNEWVQMQSCIKILNRSVKIREVEELEERLTALEKSIDNQKSNRMGRRPV